MTPALSITDLRKTYGSTVAVDDLSLEIDHGEIFGLIGPNGAGKTTTVECALGLRRPDAGSVRILDMDPQSGAPDLYRRVGAQLQNAALPHRITVHEALDLFGSFYPTTTDQRTLLERWGLWEKRNAPFEALSGGQKQRLFVALALVHNPELVILDEISTGLDPDARQSTRKLLREIRAEGTTVVLVTHFMDEAQALCDRVALMNGGRCVALDTPIGLIDRLEASYRVRFTTPNGFRPETLRAVEGVQAVDISHNSVEVRGDDDLLTTVAQYLTQHDITPENLHAERANLEEVFLSLTGDSPETTDNTSGTT